MKLTFVFLTAAFLQVQATGLSQNVSFSGKDVPMETVFAAVKQQTGYVFIFKNSTLSAVKPVSLDVEDMPLQAFLDLISAERNLAFLIKKKTISVQPHTSTVIAPTGATTESNNATSPLSRVLTDNLNLTGNLTDPPGKISGTVKSKVGESLSGVNVVVKRTGKGTITDARGEFNIISLEEDDILVFSMIGYQKQELKVKGRNDVIVFMSVATEKLDEVVVQGYGRTSERLNTGNIATIRAEQIEQQPVINPLQALQGRVAGVEILKKNGYASAPFSVEIRGRKFISNDLAPDPLFIIDGVPLTVLELSDSRPTGSSGFTQTGMTGPASGQSPLFSINPSDIESMTVLKDADATAIYGSRGASGVIIITTKKGKQGKAIFDVNAYRGVDKVIRFDEMMNTQQYVNMRREALKNDGLPMDNQYAADLVNWDTARYTNWQKFLWGKTGTTTDAQISISGGENNTTYRISAGYHHITGVTTTYGGNERISFSSNINTKSKDQKLNVSLTTFYSSTKINEITWSPQAAILPPNAPPVFDSSGKLNYGGYQPLNYLFSFASLMQPYTSTTGFLNSQLQLKYELLKGLLLSASFGYSTHKVDQKSITPIISQNPDGNPTGTSQFGYNGGVRWIVEPQVDYKVVLGKLTSTFMVGSTLQNVQQNGNIIAGFGYINDNLLGSISNAPTRFASDVRGDYKYAAVFGRMNFNYNNKYIANVSARRDGSARFGPGKQYGNFGAIGIAWIFTEENLIKDNISWLSFGKVRASYGTTGSDNIGNYKHLSRWTANANLVPPYGGQQAYIATQHFNTNLQWQENKKAEIAVLFGFLQDKHTIELAYYRDRCGNQLLDYPLPSATGFSIVTSNLNAVVQNAGWEITINTNLIKNSKTNWSLNANIGRNRNKLISYPNLKESSYSSVYIVGKPLNISQLLHHKGVDPLTGLYTFEDKNKDGNINREANDLNNDLYTKDRNTTFDGGFGSDLTYKDLTINLFFTYRRRPYTKSAIYSGEVPGALGSNQSVQMLDRWQKEGDVAKFAKFQNYIDEASSIYLGQSDGVFSDGSFVRLKTLSISYGLFKKSNNVRSLGAKIYIRGENLFLVTKYNGVDPETPVFGALPPVTTITAGLQITM